MYYNRGVRTHIESKLMMLPVLIVFGGRGPGGTVHLLAHQDQGLKSPDLVKRQ